MRLRLGGRGQSEAGAGMVVRFVEAPGAGTLGVVLYRSGDVLDVYLGDGWLRRTNRSAVAALEIEPPASLAAAAADARMFTELREGDRVRYRAANGQVVLGELLEKCRYGAIVQNDDRRLVGIGFRKLWPVPDGEPA
ncbi:MAG TPA: hypothetical protein VGP93_03950 [Polyangiaceae bacterium]|nr:hypothetical protein [Polyangiaceae bacterium]